MGGVVHAHKFNRPEPPKKGECIMPHKAERCFVCKERYDNHSRSKCKSFEFVPTSARNDKDILFAAPFQSESSAKVYSVQAWRQGDYSCNCTGWRNHRTCKHIEQVAANPVRYKGKAATAINAGAGSVVGTVTALNAKMDEAVAAAKRGDNVELAKLQAEIDYQRAMLGAAADGLTDKFAQAQESIKQHVFGETEVRSVQSAPKPVHTTVVNSHNPFGD